ncbi:alpha/beta fold hydrolase BchO [Aurantiacibacter marinus]|uniref:Alpha/beta hydrolase n=1 Tax=Aurantiacibacter marinus TaxID=874156 RepID=A0A0H0XLM3_9SPHN|nr:alpha/beta fold hydrolase BchO [Aurantiacibacter marinus]KLI62822.1 alpha/beta hydrolase [Aurantiacibacter marinus]
MSAQLNWEREGRVWPHRDASRFVKAGGLDWHVQRMGNGPELLLLHGTGASCHSWSAMMPLLAKHFTLTVPDLPGHAFTSGRLRGGPSLANMSGAIAALLEELEVKPAICAAHSAGVAIALHHAHQTDAALPIVGFSPAIMPFPGLAAKLFPAMAKALFVNPFVPRIFAASTRIPGEAKRFLRRATGSETSPENLACYEALLGNHRHCEGALAMMANWDLDSFSESLKDIANPVMLAHGRHDKAVPTGSVEAAAARLPSARLELLFDLGHLAHEEAPETAAQFIIDFAREQGVIDE